MEKVREKAGMGDAEKVTRERESRGTGNKTAATHLAKFHQA